MITDNLKDLLLQRDKYSTLNFSTLVEVLDGSKYEFVGTKLRGAMGLSTYQKAYLDIDTFYFSDDEKIFFVMLHEYCHVMKIDKMGKEEMISQLSENNFDVFSNHIVNEEILADRFGLFYFYKLNAKHYPKYRTQMLESKVQRDKYVDTISVIYGQIKDEETYNQIIEHFILD